MLEMRGSMYLKLAKSNQEFRDTYQYLIDKYELELQLFYINIIHDVELQNYHIRGGVYDENDNLALLFLNANPHRLLLFGLNNSIESTKVLVEYIENNSIAITGILGNKADTDLYIQVSKKAFKLDLAMDIMAIDEFQVLPRKGRLVVPTADDIDFIAQGICNFTKEALHDSITFYEAREKVQLYLSRGYFYLYENEEGKKTSFAGLTKRSPNSLTISAVYTFDEYRGKGYAKSMINLICEWALQQVKHVALFVDKKNPISNKVYLDNGFKYIRDNYSYIICD